MHEYEKVRRIVYGEGATFIPVCEKCNRFVKAAKEIRFDYRDQPVGTTATCKKCGPTTMIFEGYY